MLKSYSELITPLFDEVDTGTTVASFYASTADVSRPLLLLFAAHFCLSEVHNGGLLQVLWNSTGILAPEAVEGFRAVNMPSIAALLATVMELLGTPYPRDRDERWDALLVASHRSPAELEKIFRSETNLYVAFERASEPILLESLSEQLWVLAETESGGFQANAMRFAQAFENSIEQSQNK